jgi:uncharacterized protein (DUF488 family)
MTTPEPPERIIYTIGYGTESFERLAERLAPHQVQTLVDIRSIPASQAVPDFRKQELRAISAERGFGYRWLGDRLGGRTVHPSVADADGNLDEAALAESPDVVSALAELDGLTSVSTVTLLCAEVAPRECHRMSRLAPLLEAHGYRVVHILADGSAEPHQDTLDL